MSLIRSWRLDRRITFVRPAAATTFLGAGQTGHVPVATVWAEVQGELPSRAQREADGVTYGQQRTRIRIRWRSGMTSDMRIEADGRVLQIVSGPVEIGRREGLEMMAEEWTSAGGVG